MKEERKGRLDQGFGRVKGKDDKNGIFVIQRLNFILKIKIGRYEDILDKCI